MAERILAVVFLVTRDLEGLVPFYRDTLGFTVAQYRKGHSAWFDTGHVRLAIHTPEAEGDGTDYLPDAPTVIWFQPGEGVAAAKEALQKAGVELLSPPKAGNYFYLRDPEGRLLGLHEPV